MVDELEQIVCVASRHSIQHGLHVQGGEELSSSQRARQNDAGENDAGVLQQLGVLEAVIVEGGVVRLNELMELGKKHFKWVPFEIYISPAFPDQAFILWQKSETVHERRNGCIMIAE